MVKTILKHSNVIHLDSVDDIGKRKLVSTMLNDKGIHLSQPLKEALLSRLANDGYTIASVYDLSLEHNRHAIKLNSPLVLTIATSSVQGNAVSALVIDGDAVYQLPVSIGSTTLSMLTEHTGTLVILTKPTTQILSGTDPNEVITMDNDDAPFTDMATTMMRLSIFALLVVVLVVWIIFVMVNINKRKKRRRKIHAR